MTEDSAYVCKEPCPECGSRNNLARYDDGHAHCFGCGHYEHADGTTTKREARRMAGNLIQDAAPQAFGKRGLSAETAALFGYGLGTLKDKKVQVANFKDENGAVVAQHVRSANKDFVWLGDIKQAIPLWGQQLWRDGGKKVVITEGELDAMSVSQVQGNKWPVVSIKSGAQGAKRDVKKALEWLLRFEEVIFMFDMDEPGQDAARECALLLPPGKAKIATLPLKDASDMLVAGRGKELIDAIWGAKTYRPDGIVQIEDLFEEARKKVVVGLPWWHEGLTEATYGRRPGEIYGFGAGTGCGKTDWLTQQVAFDAMVLKMKVGMIYLEMPPVELTRRVLGKIAKAVYHVPDIEIDEDKRLEAEDIARGKVSIYDHWGETEWSVIESRIRYMVQAEDIGLVYLDHLTALADPANERGSLEQIMKDMAGLAQELGCIIHYVSHLATPDGKPHEEGGRVTIRHFKGSRAVGFWSFFMFGIERDQQSDEVTTTTFRVLKDRYTGKSTGRTFELGYDAETGMLLEQAASNPFSEDAANGGSIPDDEIPF